MRAAPGAGLIAGAVLLRLAVYAALAAPYGGLAEAMCQFDCGWYERIALAGYGADAEWPPNGSLPHWAFFPLYPLLLRGAVARHRAAGAAGGHSAVQPVPGRVHGGRGGLSARDARRAGGARRGSWCWRR